MPLEPKTFPVQWEQKGYLVGVRLLGVIPIGRQFVNISARDRSRDRGHFCLELRDNGRGTLMSKWDHVITIEAAPEGCRYTDRVEHN